MIEEVATVIDIHDGQVLLEAQRQSTCGTCAAKTGCGTAVFAKTLGKKSSQITTINTLNLQVGDRVLVGLHENALLLGSFMVYLIPIIGLFVFALIGQWFSQQWLNVENELWIIGFATAGFILALSFVKKFNRKIKNDSRFQPVLLKKLIS
ncbi:MAG: SoxR reducing system RseC family protein [Gammaproteobacteria bacterium]|jgi:sigma-E factor negative regulatory protein RseC